MDNVKNIFVIAKPGNHGFSILTFLAGLVIRRKYSLFCDIADSVFGDNVPFDVIDLIVSLKIKEDL